MAGAPRQDGLSFHVEVSGPEQDGSHYEVGQDGLLVGRSSACDLVFESRDVSRRHAYIYVADGSCRVKDLASKNGTFVNGQRTRETCLRDGDVADVGPNRLTVRLEGAAERPSPSPAEEPEQAVARTEQIGHNLALAALVIGALAYLHWAFGIGGAVLAATSLWEMRRDPPRGGRALAVGGLVLGLCGGLLNAWFAELAPRVRAGVEEEARTQCRQRLLLVSGALGAYRDAHRGAFPVQLTDLADAGLLKVQDLECPGRKLGGAGPALYLFLTPKRGHLARPGDVVLADADLSYHQGKGGWIVRADGQFEWLPDDLLADVLGRALAGRQGPPPPAARTEAHRP